LVDPSNAHGSTRLLNCQINVMIIAHNLDGRDAPPTLHPEYEKRPDRSYYSLLSSDCQLKPLAIAQTFCPCSLEHPLSRRTYAMRGLSDLTPGITRNT
jgi:hypothetical protein